MNAFDPHAYGPVVAELLAEPRLMPLGPGEPNLPVRDRLDSLTAEGLFGDATIGSAHAAACCLSGLWLYHDFLDASHTLSQGIHTPDGSYWHGIMHRREPDGDNAKYWFRKVGPAHPVYDALARDAVAITDGTTSAATGLKDGDDWHPLAFVDLCENARGTNTPQEDLCRRLQQREWELLFDHCWRKAVGQGG